VKLLLSTDDMLLLVYSVNITLVYMVDAGGGVGAPGPAGSPGVPPFPFMPFMCE